MKNNFSLLREHMARHIVGQEPLIERLMIAVLTDGHLLVEGLPGLAKTSAVRVLASGMALQFKRIQFTPDMIPGDITGSDIFVAQDGHFKFLAGPLFNEVILADEINRAPPKVQSALLEAMQERQVTIGDKTHALPAVFLVMATQNPIEQEGTYALPEAQLDRFMMKVELDYPDADQELEILRREQQRLQQGIAEPLQTVLTAEQVLSARSDVNSIYMDEMLARYIVTLVAATRAPACWDESCAEWIARGASPRATLALARCARARAYLCDRDFVEPGDIIELAYDVLNHRLALSFSARAEAISKREVITALIDKVPVP
ncbi:MAG: AAA domain-containing protein [Gammaproteobacteria bacterium]|nr:AAA domain-containing protein [Gammaproteobacteria bacterium]